MYLKRTLFIILITCFPFFLSAQIAFWNSYFGGSGFDIGKEIILRPDGSLVVAGEVYSSDGAAKDNHGSNSSDIIALKYSTQGVVFWKLTLGGTGMEELGEMIETRDGGYAIIGTTMSSDGDIPQAFGQRDIWVLKLDDLGNIEWNKTFGGTGNDRGYTIIETSDNGFLIGGASGSLNGTMESPHHGGIDSWLAKLSRDGELIWEKHFGGSYNEHVARIHEPEPGKYLIFNTANSRDGDVAEFLGHDDLWLFSTGESGEIEWQVSYGGNDNDRIHRSIIDAEGNIVLAGTTFSTNHDIPHQYGKGDVWLLKIEPKGKLLWSQTFGGRKADGANDICPTYDGGYVATGVVRSTDGDINMHGGYYDGWAIKVDASGTKIWSRTFGAEGKDILSSVVEIERGGFLGLGFSEQVPDGTLMPGHQGGTDIWVCNFSDPRRRGVRPYITPTALSGTIIDKQKGTGLEASVLLTDNLSLDSLAFTKSNRRNGNFMMLLPTHGLSSINVLAKGYMFYGEDIRMDTVITETTLEKKILLDPIKIGNKLILKNIYFNTGKWDLLQASYAELERLVAFLELNPGVRIEISGHTDNTGIKSQKEELSLRRANAVKDYLKEQGIKASRLTVKGYGMLRPIASNRTEDGRRQNRRVEFEVISM